MDTLGLIGTLVAAGGGDWISRNSTLVVGVVGIIMSGFVGPTVTALLTARRERQKDKRALIVTRRDDLRGLLDEAAKVLGAAVANLRPLLEAEEKGGVAPTEPAEFLGTLYPLGQRLRLRLPQEHAVVTEYEAVRSRLVKLAGATGSQAVWDAAVGQFESRRSDFLEAGRTALQAPVSDEKEI